MGIGATNRIIDPGEAYARKLNLLVKEKEREDRISRKRSFIEVGKKLMLCSQCQRWFDAKIGKAQIENKRENAPICIPCIMGIPRRTKIIDKTKNWSKETKEKFKKFKAWRPEDKKLLVIPKEESPFIGFYE